MLAELFSRERRRYTITTLTLLALSAVLGTLLHFAFDLTDKNAFIGLFTPVNESVWEHLKLLFFPFIICSAIEYFIYGREADNFFTYKLFGIITGLTFIITNYYTTVGAFGINSMALNIGIYILAVIISFALPFYKMMTSDRRRHIGWELASGGVIAIIFVLFVIFTYYPPHIPLFRDPMSMTYSVVL